MDMAGTPLMPRSVVTRERGSLAGRAAPWLVAAALLGITALMLRWQGRVWWCEEGDSAFWIGDVWTSHCSQHWADPYTVTHVSHGLIFWTVFCFWARWFPRTAPSVRWRLPIGMAIAAAWEIVENTEFVINRYRTVTMSLDYMGDSVANAVGDVIACGLGLLIARAVGWKWAMGLYALTEFALLFVMRDNLTLNVIMLFWPIEAIRQWQTPGHIGGP